MDRTGESQNSVSSQNECKWYTESIYPFWKKISKFKILYTLQINSFKIKFLLLILKSIYYQYVILMLQLH